MRFLRPDEISNGDVVRTFRHSPVGPLVMSAFFSAPLVALVFGWENVLRATTSLPWFGWIVVGPVLALVALIWWVCLAALRSLVHASFLSSNWLVKTTRDGFYLQLRSYQNHHFLLDGPTVVFFSFGEVARTRRVTESFEAGSSGDRSRRHRRWLELQLVNVDTAPLEAWLAAERARPAPRTRTLGVKSSVRFGHVPVLVPRAGVVYVDWLGRGLLDALAEHVATVEDADVALDASEQRTFETRIGELVARGETIAAVGLARDERNLSLTEAHSLIRSVRERRRSSTAA
jgi:hypothetical protein